MFPLSPDGSPSQKKKLSQAEVDAREKARHEKEQKRLAAMLSNFCKNGVPQGGFLRSINLEQFGIESGSNITNATVQELCAILPGGIDELIISNCVDVTDVACWAIARHCPDIKSLIMAHCNQITNIGLRSLSLKCSELKKLDFTGCHLLDDLALATLAGGSWEIEDLRLTDCSGITDSGLSKIARAATHLKVLDLRGCTSIGDYGDKGMKDVGTFCNQLEELNVSGCKRIEDPGMRAIIIGCPKLRKLKVSGCSDLTGISIKAICKHSGYLNELALIGGSRLTDRDMSCFLNAKCRGQRLTQIDFTGAPLVTDKGIQHIMKSFGDTLRAVNFAGSSATDEATQIIATSCQELRSLDLSRCARISDETVHIAAQQITALTTLKLDGNPAVTTKTLMSYVGPKLEFAEMASHWIGYRPKPNTEELIAKREQFRIEVKAIMKIQCLFRRRRAMYIYRERHRWWSINKAIPKAQACWRGHVQYEKYKIMKRIILERKSAILIQTTIRGYWQRVIKTAKLKALAYKELKTKCAILIQKTYWGMLGRRRVIKRRDEIATAKLEAVRRQALREHSANIIQRNYRAYIAVNFAVRQYKLREIREARIALEERMIRLIQRICYGKLGRNKMKRRREYLARLAKEFDMAREIQRVYRGHVGRMVAERRAREKWIAMRNAMALKIQKRFRGMRGRVLAAIAKALKILRAKQNFAAVEMQRFIRGCLARDHVKQTRAKKLHEKIVLKASMLIQRIFRGHKGRESGDVERKLAEMEALAKPLITQLKELEDKASEEERLLKRLISNDERMEREMKDLEVEFLHCLETTSKFTDCDKINGIPQRYLTKYLRIRLKDHYDHQNDLFITRRKELAEKKIEFRELEKQVASVKRELIPLTTGMVVHTKKARSKRLRDQVRKRRDMATRIQARIRGIITRKAYKEPDRDHWIECFDQEQGEDPYYYNRITQEKTWRKNGPWAFRLFCRRFKKFTDIDYEYL